MGLDEKKKLFGACEQQKRQPASLRIRTVWSAPLLFAYWKVPYLDLLQAKSFSLIAGLCSWADWFESHFVGNPEDRVSRVAAHITIKGCRT